jgi:flagellar assembly protein FliH
MSERQDSAKPDSDDFGADTAPDPFALAPGADAGGPIDLPEPVLGMDEDAEADAARSPFLADLEARGATATLELAAAEEGIEPATPAPPDGAPADDAAAPMSSAERARSRRTWRELRYAAITQEKPEVVVPPPVIDEHGRLIRKYLFEHSFDIVEAPPEPEPEEEQLLIEEPVPEPVEVVADEPPPPTFSEAEVAAARAAGYEDGQAAGRKAAGEAIETRIVELVQQLATAIPGLAADRDQAIASVSHEAARLAHAMVRRLMPEVARRYRTEEIEAVVVDSLNKALDQPRIIIRTPADLTSYLTDRLETVARQHGFGGRVIVLSDQSLGPSDVKVEWSDGGADRCVQRAWSDVEAIVARVVERLEQIAPTTEIPPGEPGDTIGSAA